MNLSENNNDDYRSMILYVEFTQNTW